MNRRFIGTWDSPGSDMVSFQRCISTWIACLHRSDFALLRSCLKQLSSNRCPDTKWTQSPESSKFARIFLNLQFSSILILLFLYILNQSRGFVLLSHGLTVFISTWIFRFCSSCSALAKSKWDLSEKINTSAVSLWFQFDVPPAQLRHFSFHPCTYEFCPSLAATDVTTL